MNSILLPAFLQSFASTCLSRGVFFFTTNRLGYGDRANLWLAFAMGLVYVVGALASHRFAARLGERAGLTVLFAAELAVALAMATGVPGVVLAGTVAISALDAMKWPIVESYVAAGHGPDGAIKALGRFNFTWSGATAVGLMASGPLIHAGAAWLFLVPALLHAASLALLVRLPARPAHLADDHPERMAEAEAPRLQALLDANRWLMVLSYASVYVISPLIPGILGRLGFAVAVASALGSLIDVTRVVAFAALGLYAGWHGRAWPAWVAAAMLPLGFFLILLAPGSAVCVLGGEMLFGLGMGIVYYASLYYAMVIRNAAVEAGGAHEALIGSAFTVGPIAALAGAALAPALGRPEWATVAALGPVFALTLVAAARALARGRRAGEPRMDTDVRTT